MEEEIESYPTYQKVREDVQSSEAGLDGEFEELENIVSDNVLTENQTRSSKHSLFFLKNKIKLNFKKIMERLKNHTESNEVRIGNVSSSLDDLLTSSDVKENPNWSYRLIDPSKVYGFGDEIMSLVGMLVRDGSNDKFTAFGIVGMIGTGKTTLCQVLLTRVEVRNHFVLRIWVSLSGKPNRGLETKIATVQRMLRSLGVKEGIVSSVSEKHGLSGLLYALYVRLRGKRYLIVFDDVCDGEEWYGQLNSSLPHNGKGEERLAYALPKGCGGAVIVTSRNEEFAKKMVGEENVHYHPPLSDSESCWSIFMDSIQQDETPFNFMNMDGLKNEIMQACGGVPLAAKVMGQIVNENINEGSVPPEAIQAQQATERDSSGV